jgi:PAS domain S-box-containing protein
MILFSLILLIIAASAIITKQKTEIASKQERIASSIAQGASELSYLSNDYLIYRESQQLSRWQSRFASLSSQVASLNVDKPEQQILVHNIKANEQRLKQVFDSVASAMGGPPQNRSMALDLAFLQVSWSRMAVQTQGLVSDASRLSQLLYQQVDQLREIRTMLMYAMVGLFGLFLLASYMLTYRRILKSISTLQAGTAAIGSGNLDFMIEEKRNDEIGDLSHAFNQMTFDLKAVTASKVDLEREVTRRKQAEEELRQQREWLRVTLSSIGDAVIASDTEGRITFLNPVAVTLTGWQLEETLGQPIQGVFRIINEKTHAPAEDLVARVLNEKRMVALSNDTALVTKDGREVPIEDSAAPIKEASGNVTGVVLVFHDVTERRRAQAALHESEERFRAVFESSSDCILVWDRQYNYLYANQAAIDHVGTTRDKVIGKNIRDALGHVPDFMHLWMGRVDRAFATGEPFRVEDAMPVGDRLVHSESQVSPIRDAEGKVFAVGVVYRDTTERKRAEEALLEAHERAVWLARFPEQNPNPIIRASADGTVLYCNPSTTTSPGWKCEVGQPLPHPLLPLIGQAMAEKQEVEQELELGGRFHLIWVAPFPEEGYANIYARDITERKRAEERIRRHNIVHEGIGRIFQEDLSGRTDENLGRICLSVVEQVTESKFSFIDETGPDGYLHDLAISDPGWEACAMYDQTGHRRPPGTLPIHGIYGRVVADAKSLIVNDPSSHADRIGLPEGHPPLTAFLGVPFIQDGKTIGMVAVGNRKGGYTLEQQQDLEAMVPAIFQVFFRKRAEDALRESEERLNRAQEIAHLGSWELDLVNNRLTWSDEVYRIFGLQPQEFGATYEAFLEAAHPDDRAAVDAAYSGSVREGRDTYEIEHRVVRKSTGEIRIVHERCEHIRDASGRIIRSIGMVHDITDRKQAEEALRKSEERFKAIATSTPDHLFVQDRELRYELVINPQLGLTEQDMIGKTDYDILSKEDADKLTRIKRQVLESGNPVDLEMPLISKKGEQEFFDGSYIAKLDGNGQTDGLIGYFRNVTERKRMEEKLRQSEEKSRLLIKHAPSMFYEIDFRGPAFKSVNDTMCQFLGYSREELLAMNPFDLLDDEGKAIFRERIKRKLAGETISDSVEYKSKTKDGREVHGVLNITFTYKDGKPEGAVVVAHDITERKRAEEALQQRKLELQRLAETLEQQVQERTEELAEANKVLRQLSIKILSAQEEERKRIAGELHDTIGSYLGGIKFKVESAIQEIAKTPKAATQSLNTIVPVIQEAVEECRRIQQDLRPSMLDDLGLLPTLSWFCRRFQTLYSRIRVDKEVTIEESEVPPPLKIVVFRITQEALNNVAKHSKASTVRLCLRKIEGRMELVVEDNGRGIDLEKIFEPKTASRGLGLTNMRERAELSGGSFVVESTLGKGTTVRASWPI